MTLFSAALDAVAALRGRALFSRICAACDLKLYYAAHRDDVAVLREVFFDRVYSDWFPLRRRAVVVDVGAHKGFFTIFAARRLLPGSMIVAVEPESRNAAQLRLNLAANRVVDVRVVQGGVDAATGRAQLGLSRSENHTLHPEHLARLRRAPSGAAFAPIDVLSLGDLLDRERLSHVDFLKLDCEGAEYATLFAADAATLARIDVISLEFHDLGKAGCTGRDLADYLSLHGFRIARFTHGPSTIDNDYGRLVAVASRRSPPPSSEEIPR
jgi:FkbM family methyltransferase